jgi:hypothetical protein
MRCCEITIGRQVRDRIDVGLPVAREAALLEQREGVVQLALRFSADRVEDDRGLTGARDPSEHRNFTARYVERDVLQVVLARAADLDEVVHVASPPKIVACRVSLRFRAPRTASTISRLSLEFAQQRPSAVIGFSLKYVG